MPPRRAAAAAANYYFILTVITAVLYLFFAKPRANIQHKGDWLYRKDFNPRT